MNNFKVFTIITVLLFIFGTASAYSQSMDVIDALLAQEEAEFGESMYMLAVGSGLITDSASINEAMLTAADQKWISADAEAGEPISYGDFAFAVMNAYDIKGGVMYMLLPSPRYAARELSYLEFHNDETHPGQSIGGDDVINIILAAAEYKEAE